MLCENAIATVQANMCKRVLRASVARGHMEARDAKDMAAYAHGGGFSVDAGVRIEAPDRAGLERLLRCCAGPSLAMDRLKQHGADLVCGCGKGHSEPLQSEKYSGELVLTPPELINRIAQLVPPPRTHRDRCCGVLAPNSPLRAAVTAMAHGCGTSGRELLRSSPSASTVDIRKVLAHIGVEPEAPRIAPGRGPPLWDGCGAQEMGEGVEGFAGLGSGRSAHHLVNLLQWAVGRDDCAEGRDVLFGSLVRGLG
jgi:hypothetical protein